MRQNTMWNRVYFCGTLNQTNESFIPTTYNIFNGGTYFEYHVKFINIVT